MNSLKKVMLVAGVSLMGLQAASAQEARICVTTWDLTNPYWVNLVNGIQERAREIGAEVIVADPANDVNRQVAALENFTTSGCGVIIVAPIDPASTQAPLELAREAGIHIIAQSIETPVADVWVSADERDMGYAIGQEAGRWISERLGGEGEVLILNNDRIPQMIARKDGIREGIAELAPNARIVADQPAANTAEALSVTETVLQANPNTRVVVAINDASALGALAAVESSGIATDDVFVGGIDATPQARAAIEGGTAFRASVDNVPFENGRRDVDIAKSLLDDEELEYRQVVDVKAYTGN